ncbi:hypothetical protein SAMN06269185_3278 [Natronoarchaeum philippinense]|uniref:Uncharacterized protein n=1 Tax=Natronoarchaeum philippinense TaxID=558529 RepID=A0A285PAD1_NATPI|nr:hypothetical protein [Natronoarchaeum philippinense]SNZ18173.1 hypothetical protein SAMN06269185_3278 [Natronoarchaeum philippinense]
MSLSESQSGTTAESGALPGRYEWVEEPSPGAVPTDPEWNRFSDVIRTFEMDVGATLARQDSLGTPDAVDHNRGPEEPEATVGYDLQQFPVDGSGNPVDASAYGILRDQYNDLLGTLLAVGRREYGGGNDGAGVREYSVVRGAGVDSVSPTLDPSGEQPILMELGLTTRKNRSYKIHQPSAGTTLDIVSTNANDTMDITIESEDGSTTETIALTGDTAVTTTSTFSDIDAIWLADNPEGNVTISDGSGTTLCELTGGLEYSDDDQPVDGDRGVPPTGAGSHASAIGSSFEHFVGDRFERPAGEAVRARINSASWTVENNINTQALHQTRAPALDAGNRDVSVDADAAGPYVSHKSMMESLQKVQQDIEHELSGGTVRFKNGVPTDSATRTIEAEQAVASVSETFGCSGDPAIELEASN